jgi:hypothetical protein
MANEKEVSKDAQIQFHSGALSILVKEREEMQKILAIVEQQIRLHVEGLKKLGVDLEKAAKEAKKASEKKKPIEERLK